MMIDRKKIVEVLREENSFYLISHMLPDGDSIGSLLAMGAGLKQLGKQVKMFSPGQIPKKYQFLSGTDKVSNEPAIDDPEIPVIVLDSSDLDRLGAFTETVSKSKVIINIDHHITNQNYGTLNLVDSLASATGEIVYEILGEAGVDLNQDLAEALYVAIATDTGSFKYENTTPQTHRITASLLEHNLNPSQLSQRVFDERPLPFYVLLKEALSGLEFFEGGAIAVMTLSKDIRERSGAESEDLEGIVNYARNIEGVELGVLFYVDKDNEVKVGFRSKILDVSELAGRLNGGGHTRAAGCRLTGQYTEAKDVVMAEAIKIYRNLPA